VNSINADPLGFGSRRMPVDVRGWGLSVMLENNMLSIWVTGACNGARNLCRPRSPRNKAHALIRWIVSVIAVPVNHSFTIISRIDRAQRMSASRLAIFRPATLRPVF